MQFSGNISPIWGEAPTAPIETKICMVGHFDDIIMYAKFQDDIFRGYDFTGGRISHFPINFCMGLTTVQRYSTALPVMCVPECSSLKQTRLQNFRFLMFIRGNPYKVLLSVSRMNLRRHLSFFSLNESRLSGIVCHLPSLILEVCHRSRKLSITFV